MKLKLLLITLISFSSFFIKVWAQEVEQQNIPSTSEVVNEYFELKEMGFLDKHIPRDCRPQSGSCFRTACDTVDTFECDDQDEMDTLRRACRGNWGDGCIKLSVKFLDVFEYDDLEDMETLANSCRGVYDLECVNYSCRRMEPFGCDDLEEIVDVNLGCSGSRY